MLMPPVKAMRREAAPFHSPSPFQPTDGGVFVAQATCASAIDSRKSISAGSIWSARAVVAPAIEGEEAGFMTAAA